MKPIKQLADELGKDIEELIKLKNEKVPKAHTSGYGKNTKLDEEGERLVRQALEAPLTVPDYLHGKVLADANNNRWVWVKIEGRENRHLCLVPRKLRGKLVGKRIAIHAITDATGATTFRHAALGH